MAGADGVSIGTLTAGTGPALLLVHGGMGRLERWQPMWASLTSRWRVTAMDRRGRGSSGDSEPYEFTKEYDDIAAVAASLADEQGGPVDVFAHSIGATYALGAATRSSAVRRLALYEPPGPPTVPAEWLERVSAMVAAGQPGRAMFSFLTEIIGLTPAQVEELRDSPAAQGVLPIVSATMPREGRALASVDPRDSAPGVTCPVLLLLGSKSPPWASEISRGLAETIATAELVILPGHGHEAIDSAPDLVVSELQRYFDADVLPAPHRT